jgi:hypothetical protein
MQQYPNYSGPSQTELRTRAVVRVARRRAFFVSATILGALILLNLYFYSQDHRSTWLVLDAVFAGILAFRAWNAFGSHQSDERRIQVEISRMQQPPEQYVPRRPGPQQQPSAGPAATPNGSPNGSATWNDPYWVQAPPPGSGSGFTP